MDTSREANEEEGLDELAFNIDRVEDWQRRLKPGDCFCVVEPNQQLIIYGIVQRQPKQTQDPAAIWAKVFSRVCPKGDFEWTFRPDMDAPLTKHQFKLFKKMGWPHEIEALHILLGVQRTGYA